MFNRETYQGLVEQGLMTPEEVDQIEQTQAAARIIKPEPEAEQRQPGIMERVFAPETGLVAQMGPTENTTVNPLSVLTMPDRLTDQLREEMLRNEGQQVREDFELEATQADQALQQQAVQAVVMAPSMEEREYSRTMNTLQMQEDLSRKEYEASRFDILAQQSRAFLEESNQRFERDLEQRRIASEEKINRVEQELKENQVDPSRFWNSRTTFQKVVLAIGAMFGGSGPNSTQAFLQKMIEQDVEQQRRDTEGRFKLMDMYRNQFRDEQSSILALRKAHYDQVSAMLGIEAQRTGDRMKQMQIFQVQQQMQAQAQEQMRQLQIRQYIADQQGKVTPEIARMLPEAEQKKYVPGLQQFALDESSAKEARKMDADFQSIQGIIERAKSFREGFEDAGIGTRAAVRTPVVGRVLPTSRAIREDSKVIINQLQAAIAGASPGLAMNPRTREILDAMTGESLTSIYGINQIQELEATLREQYRAKMSSLGLRVPDPNDEENNILNQLGATVVPMRR